MPLIYEAKRNAKDLTEPKNKALKALSVAALAGLAFMGAGAGAAEIEDSEIKPSTDENTIISQGDGAISVSLSDRKLKGTLTGGAAGIVVNSGENVTISDEILTGYEKTEEKSNPGGTYSSPYVFEGGAVLRVLKNATANFTQ